jgi:hypothetical protein
MGFADVFRKAVYDKTGGHCYYCGMKLTLRSKTKFPEVDPAVMLTDHFVPKSKGGSDHIDNIVPCCRPCNSGKNNKPLEQYRSSCYWKSKGISFTPKQREFLKSTGYYLSKFENSFKFWFEEKKHYER